MILVIGDSWTYGFGLRNKAKVWPNFLSKYKSEEVVISARSGVDNRTMSELAIQSYNYYKPDRVIIGWSGISRIRFSKKPYIQFSLSFVPKEDSIKRKNFFRNTSLQTLSKLWLEQINYVESHIKCSIIHFSVFGDQNCISHSNLLEDSMLEKIAFNQGTTFVHDIPIFEFDFLHKKNKVAEDFCEREFDKKWIKACVERENIRPGEMFLDSGHPNEAGHKYWANYLKDKI